MWSGSACAATSLSGCSKTPSPGRRWVMRTNERGLAIIKSFEGLRLKAYLCPAGVWTIGWGHTGDVKRGDVVTEHQAEALLDVDLDIFERGVQELCPKVTSPNQFSALVSFAFNVGLGKPTKEYPRGRSFYTSTLRALVNSGRHELAALQFARWSKASVNGTLTTLPGLLLRRAAEAALYLRPDDP